MVDGEGPALQAATEANRRKSVGDRLWQMPGLLPAAGMAVLAGVGCWMWLLSQGAAPDGPAAIGGSVLAEVSESDVADALPTMEGTPTFLAQFKDRKTGCAKPLAWISLTGVRSQPASKVRVKSGSYFSPLFTLSGTPVRVAVPFPAPYEVGRGVLTVFTEGGGAIVSLRPAWRTPDHDGAQSHAVSWQTTQQCKNSHE